MSDNEIHVHVRHPKDYGGRCDTLVTDQHGRMIRGIQRLEFVADVCEQPTLVLYVIPARVELEGAAEIRPAKKSFWQRLRAWWSL